MPNINNWLTPTDGSGQGITEADRALDAWRRINDNPAMVHSIVLRRNGVKKAGQTVRVEFGTGSERSDTDENATLYRITGTLFGVRNHPDDAVLDTDILPDDEFGIGGVRYRVRTVLLFAGEVQATFYRVE